jgi:acyl-CoA thioester hydrolase
MSVHPTRGRRVDYRHFLEISTRWNDNDSYRHVNNVVYYEFFDILQSDLLPFQGARRSKSRASR